MFSSRLPPHAEINALARALGTLRAEGVVVDLTESNPTRAGIFGGHTNFGDPDRSWDFRSLGRGSVDFEEIIRALNDIGYNGPLSVEWEDSGMDREHGAEEACDFVNSVDFPTSGRAFDASFAE